MNLFDYHTEIGHGHRLPRQLYHEEYARLGEWLFWFVNQQGDLVDTEEQYVYQMAEYLDQKQAVEGRALHCGWLRFADKATLAHFSVHPHRVYDCYSPVRDDPDSWEIPLEE